MDGIAWRRAQRHRRRGGIIVQSGGVFIAAQMG